MVCHVYVIFQYYLRIIFISYFFQYFSATPNKRLSVVVPQTVLSPAAEYWLSIGRIFHRVTLSSDKNTIKVSRYSPRHPYEIKKSHYRYRFEAPDNDNYEVSWYVFRY